MGGDEDIESGEQLRGDHVLPVREHPGDDVGEALAGRAAPRAAQPVAPIVDRMLGAGQVDGWRRHVEATPPQVGLLGAVALGGLLLVESLQGAVVALVEPPVALHRQPFETHLDEGQVVRGDGPYQYRGVRGIEAQTGVAINLPAATASALPCSVSGTSR